MATKRARKKSTKKDTTRRGSPEAIEKRRVARALNTLLTAPAGPKVDKRTERRRKRLLDELKSGKRGKNELKPLDALSHAQALIEIGEPMTSIRKAAGRRYKVGDVSGEVRTIANQTQAAYGFDTRVWSLLGIALEGPAPKAPKKRRAARKK